VDIECLRHVIDRILGFAADIRAVELEDNPGREHKEHRPGDTESPHSRKAAENQETPSRCRSPRLRMWTLLHSPGGRRSAPSTISAFAGTARSTVSHCTSSAGSLRIPPRTSSSSTSRGAETSAASKYDSRQTQDSRHFEWLPQFTRTLIVGLQFVGRGHIDQATSSPEQ